MKKNQHKPAAKAITMPLGRVNYIMIAIGVLVIAGTYFGMSLEREVDGFFALNISPFTLIGAYIWIAFAIMYKPKPKKSN
ncbi:MAG: hypothetical protein WCK32_06245 [Chlorobiaceae bacterium]